MKAKIIALALIVYVSTVMFSQQEKKQFHIHAEENEFYLLMPVNDVYTLLGDPVEVQRLKTPYRSYDTVILSYHEIQFIYYDFFENPEVLVIGFTGKNKAVDNQNLIGHSKNDILKEYGEPKMKFIEKEKIHFRYEFILSRLDYISLQFRFDTLGICDGIILTHSNYQT